jgi:hypothetical protein
MEYLHKTCQLENFNISNDFLRLKRKTGLVSVPGNANKMTRQDFDWNSLNNKVIHAINGFRVERFRVGNTINQLLPKYSIFPLFLYSMGYLTAKATG